MPARVPIGFAEPICATPSGNTRAWLTTPHGICVQAVTPAATEEYLPFVVDTVWPMMQRAFVNNEKLLFVHDGHEIQGIPQGHRKYTLDWAIRIRARVAQIIAVVGEDMPAVLKLTMASFVAILSTSGMPVAVEYTSLDRALQKHRVRPYG